jgi:hypothetical protein
MIMLPRIREPIRESEEKHHDQDNRCIIYKVCSVSSLPQQNENWSKKRVENILIFPPVTGNTVGKQKKTVNTMAQITQTTFDTYPTMVGTLNGRFGGR